MATACGTGAADAEQKLPARPANPNMLGKKNSLY
jgi:hypothetical protein